MNRSTVAGIQLKRAKEQCAAIAKMRVTADAARAFLKELHALERAAAHSAASNLYATRYERSL